MDDEQLRQRSALIAEGLERDPAGLDGWLATLEPGDASAVRRALDHRAHAGFESGSLGGVSAGEFAHLLTAAVERDARPAAHEGETLGAWVLDRKLGEGGMGEVWLASRGDGLYQGKAAIKLLRADLDRSLVERRFAREREVLARLDHPNIARLLDAGLSKGDQHPFLVLEFVEGATLLSHAHEAKLDTRGRVRLARIVADAVAYAHGRLVVHRDLKPQNVLVTGKGEPKVLDFGIAGLLDDESPVGEGLTRTAGRALTLEYCAPEQLTGAPVDVRSDVYSLGVVLFELLAGTRPHTPGETSRRALEYSIVHEEARALDGAKFDSSLVSLVAKSLAREPERRYPTMAAFAEDLARWLEHRPVLATTPTSPQRVLMWARRNRALAAATAGALAAVVLGLVVSLWLAGEARQQERIAIAALADAKAQSASAQAALTRAESESTRAEREAANARDQASIARDQASLATAEGLRAKRDEAKARDAESLAMRANTLAQSEARKARAVSDFVVDLFQAADPEKSRGEKLTARDLIDAGVAGVERFAGEPDTRTELQRVLGTSYNQLSRPDKAVPLLAAAARAQEATQGRGSPERARTLLTLAQAEGDVEKFAEAVDHFRESLPVVEAADGAMAAHVVTGKVAYAFALCKTGKHAECVAMAETLADDVRARLGERHWLHVEAQNGRATALSVVGRWREMLAILQPLEPLLAAPPPGKLADSLTIRANLAISMARNGNIQGAVDRLAPLSADLASHLGPENDKTLVHTWYLAEYQRQLARFADCHAQYAKLAEVRSRVTGPTHPLTVDVLSKAALCARSAGDEAAARAFLRRAEAALPASDTPPQRTVLRTLLVLANVSLDLGEREKAAALLARGKGLLAALKLETSDEWIMLTLIDSQRRVANEAGAAAEQLGAMLGSEHGKRALGMHSALGMHAYQLALAGNGEEAAARSEAARKVALARLPAGHPYFAVLDYVDALSRRQPTAPALAAIERAAGRPAPLPLAPLWFTL